MQLFVRGPVGVLPEFLRGRAFPAPCSAPLPATERSRAGDRAGELLGFAGQDVFEFFFDVDVFVELVDQVVGDRCADLLVLDQLVAGVDPVVGVERLAFDPDREDAEEGEASSRATTRSFDQASASAAHRW